MCWIPLWASKYITKIRHSPPTTGDKDEPNIQHDTQKVKTHNRTTHKKLKR